MALSIFGSSSPTASLIQLDMSTIGLHYEAKVALRTLGSTATSTAALNAKNATPPTAKTPWDQAEDTRSLERRIAEFSSTRPFIDTRSAAARLAGGNKDAETLFTLYQALSRLKDIAEYASDPMRTSNSRSTLDALVQRGLGEIKSYINSATLDKLDLLYGTKTSSVKTTVGLGKNETRYAGQKVESTDKTTPISGLTGNEVFTITLSKASGSSDDFVIDLSEISGPISMQAIADLVNSKIAALQETNALGELVSKYGTRMTIDKVEGGYAFAFSGMVAEDVRLTAAAPEPSLFLVGTSTRDKLTSATLTRLDDLDGTPTEGTTQTFNSAGVTIREVKDEKSNDPLNGRSNAVIEKMRGDLDTFYKDLGITREDEAEARPLKDTSAAAVAVDSSGHVYMIGKTTGDIDNNINRSDKGDVYLTKYDAAGNVIWQRLLGASGEADGFAIAIDSEDNVVVAGRVNGTLTGSELFKGTDSFVRKYSDSGDVVWTRQLDTVAEDTAFAVTIDANNDVIIAGQVDGVIKSGLSQSGGTDAYVARISGTTGTLAAAAQFGTSGHDSARAIAVASDGNILVASQENGQAVLRKLDASDLTTVLWSETLGDIGNGAITSIAVEGDAIYIAGHVGSADFGRGTVAQGHNGNQDGFVMRIDDNGGSGSAAWTSFIGSDMSDYIQSITVSNGNVYVAGRTGGDLAAQKSGQSDAFAAKINGDDGATEWVHQIDHNGGNDGATGIAFAAEGNSVLTKLGFGAGELQVRETRDVTTQTTARPGDYFYISVNGGPKVKITIREGDTFQKIASRINTVSLRHVKAEQILGGATGARLQIAAKNGGEVQIFAGDGDRDALKSLGLEPTKIFTTDRLFELNEDDKKTETKLGGIFGFKLEDGLSVSSANAAKYLLGKINDAMTEVQRAYRSLYRDPIAELLKSQSKGNSSGPVPAHLSRQLANYQSGLDRLMAGSSSGTYI